MSTTASSKQSGFTLVEVMIVVALIGLVAAVAVPNFVRARTLSRKNTCITNLRQLENAKLVWANESLKGANDTPTDADLFGSTKYLRERPLCPAGGRYTLTPVSTPTECSLAELEGHAL
jgi:prepilin-type N-terminal cleavage/methylation domain-containing protein